MAEPQKNTVQKPRGTRDFVPREMEKRRWLEGVFRGTMERFGFREAATPAFEHTELFTMRSGPGIINDMYAFKDKGGRDISLRPELTAPIIRLYVEELVSAPKPLKLFYFGNCFRYENPQKGRYREFWQFGCEILGARKVPGEVELLSLAHGALRASGLKNFVVRIGHVGVLRKLLEDNGISKERQSPLMPLIDKKNYDGLKIALEDMKADARTIVDVLSSSGGREVLKKVPDSGLDEVLDGLEDCGVKDYIIEPGIARGLDYYTGMVFEVDVPDLGAEKQVCGGGSYSLAELFGAENIESTGFAIGFDRVLVALEAQKAEFPSRSLDYYVIPMGAQQRHEALKVLTALRNAGRSADIDLSDRNFSKALKYASGLNAKEAILVGEEELKKGVLAVKDMASGKQREAGLEELTKK
jgi:histidyl-tRNA synthetase